MSFVNEIKKTYLKIRKIFNKNEFLLELETEILQILGEKKEEFEKIANNKIDEYTPILKDKLANIIIENMKLKFPLNLFKKTIKKNILKNYDKLVTFLKEQLK